jgi:hypothetical protein
MAATRTTGEQPKTSAEHIELSNEAVIKPSEVILDAATKGQAVSGYEGLGVWNTIKTFKICTVVCFAMAFSAATDGYQIGSVVSLMNF